MSRWMSRIEVCLQLQDARQGTPPADTLLLTSGLLTSGFMSTPAPTGNIGKLNDGAVDRQDRPHRNAGAFNPAIGKVERHETVPNDRSHLQDSSPKPNARPVTLSTPSEPCQDGEGEKLRSSHLVGGCQVDLSRRGGISPRFAPNRRTRGAPIEGSLRVWRSPRVTFFAVRAASRSIAAVSVCAGGLRRGGRAGNPPPAAVVTGEERSRLLDGAVHATRGQSCLDELDSLDAAGRPFRGWPGPHRS
jgi:hypothetical protein